MFGIPEIIAAAKRLAASLNATADAIDEATAQLRQHLDGPEPQPLVIENRLPAAVEETNGRRRKG